MILFVRKPASIGRGPSVVTLFGVGLIGGAVCDAVMSGGEYRARTVPTPWGDPTLLKSCLSELSEAVEGLVSSRPGTATNGVAVVWCAGRCAFSASDQETAPELHSFKAVLRWAESLSLRRPSSRVAFHMVSSAGGLFEGCVLVGRGQKRRTERPYGRLKRDQEDLLTTSDAPLKRWIYRPSSVFGEIRPRTRRGLIPTMILNGLLNRVTQIIGDPTTLRDYVWHRDVGTYIARQIEAAEPDGSPAVRMLCSGKPTSILEVKARVEELLGMKKLYISIRPEATNASDITFSPNVLPADWVVTDLELCMRRIYDDFIHGGRSAARAGTRRRERRRGSSRSPVARRA